MRGGHSSSGSYHSLYPGRYIYNSFGRSSYSRRKSQVPLDPAARNRWYYEKKMAEWREKHKHILEDQDEEFQEEDNSQNPSDESLEYDYDYDSNSPGDITSDPEAPEETTEVPEDFLITSEATTNDTLTVSVLAEPEVSSHNLTESTTLRSNMTSAEEEDTTTSTDSVPEITERSTRAARRAYGLRYGRVKVERLQ
ncbi:unnamed protein product [Allacma fusca]|uniref:Uncharacterized protein n=1 Tax=Allacma fusca TaxID=39272 RepID=A0A8J2KMZ9_9HEXA|nr:unnamed protein product [Allacma fusca]